MINFNKSLVLETHRMALAYDDAGTGGSPILLLHGWACDRTFLQPQFEHLSRFHRVFAIDLSGHGQSDAPLRNYTLAEFAADIHYFHRALDLPPALIVGHASRGCSGSLPHRFCDVSSARAHCDVPASATRFGRLRLPGCLGGSRRAAVHRHRRSFSRGRFDGQDETHAATCGCRGIPAHLLDYDFAVAAAACEVPAAYLGASRRLGDVDRFRDLCPQLVTGQTLGSGHFSPLEVPDQVNAMIDQFLVIMNQRR